MKKLIPLEQLVGILKGPQSAAELIKEDGSFIIMNRLIVFNIVL